MKTPNEIVRRITQQAMERHRLSQRGLAHEIGCGDGSIAKLLDEQEVRLTQEQWFYLMTRETACVNGCSWAHTPVSSWQWR